MENLNEYIDVNFEEVSSQRDVCGDAFSKGLIEYRFSVSPSAGGAWIPSMSYFMIDYKLSTVLDDTKALESKSKITMACDWPSQLFSTVSFKIAGYEVCSVNNYCAQTHILKKRMGYVSEDFNGLAYNRDGYDADFSRRLARSSEDGTYHKDGVRDCTNSNQPLTTTPQSIYHNGAGRELKNSDTSAALLIANKTINTTLPATGTGLTLTSAGGVGTIGFDAGNSAVLVGDYITVGTATGLFFAAGYVSVKTSDKVLTFIPTVYVDTKTRADAAAECKTVLSIQAPGAVVNTAQSTVADPRSGKTDGSVMYQPPVGIFDINDPTKLFGDFSIVFSPNQNFLRDVVESIEAKAENVDYKFSITGMKFYIAKCKIPQMPNPNTQFSLDEFSIQGKTINVKNGQQTFDFILPPSTNKIVVFIQDSDVTTTNVSSSRLKVRQFGDPAWKNKYGNYANTFDEYLRGIQVTYSGITKPQSLFQAVTTIEKSNPMLHRWILSNIMNKTSSPESFDEWLSMGSYYVFDYTRDELSNGSYANIRIDYGAPEGVTDITKGGPGKLPDVILHCVAICTRDIAISYDQGRVSSVRSQLE